MLHHATQVLIDIAIPEALYPKAALNEMSISQLVFVDVFGVAVLTAVNFND